MGVVGDLPSVVTTISGPCLVVKVRGAMDYVWQPELRERLKKVIAPGERAVVLDLADVTFCDSAGLNVLLGAHREARTAGVALVLVCVPGTLHRVLEMTRADQILRVFDTVAEAEAVCGARQ
ncbi:STAS domain-containing protein [Streptomyces sp. NPDC048420]|uniref:STAS domain-containing protein n=1 Tax=Streptomyces sp. NPDC048420 TaxID=3155755 RepID=UPI003424A154